MWKIPCTAHVIAGVLALLATVQAAEAQNINNSNTQNFGFNLPNTPVPHGFDEVRAADGTTCRSAVAGNGPYVDVGGIASEDRNGNFGNATVYGRIVFQLGQRPRRVNCRTLYQLEIDRLRHELKLARSGINSAANRGNADDWQNSGWNNE